MLFIKNKETLFPRFIDGNNSRFLLLLFLTFSNFWIINIFLRNPIYGLVISFVTLVLGFKYNSRIIIIFSLVVLIFIQLQTTSIKSLTILENDQQRVQQERIKMYPPVYIDLFFKVIWLKPADWIEKSNFIIALSRIEENLFENLDLNKYFFAGFPRNTPADFQKFPFVLMPLFIIGLIKLIKGREFLILTALLFAPILILSLTGTNSALGPVVLFPFFIISILQGIKDLSTKFKNKKTFYIILSGLILLTLFIQISYETNK